MKGENDIRNISFKNNMNSIYKINIFSENENKLQDFLNKFYNNEKNKLKDEQKNNSNNESCNGLKNEHNEELKDDLKNKLKFEKSFENPVDMIDLLSTLIDNNDKYPFGIWISIDKDIFINISELNLDKIIRYLLERYPY